MQSYNDNLFLVIFESNFSDRNPFFSWNCLYMQLSFSLIKEYWIIWNCTISVIYEVAGKDFIKQRLDFAIMLSDVCI